MVVHPLDIFNSIKVFREINSEYYRIVFPAVDLEDFGHGIVEFFEDHLNFCNGKWGNGKDVVTFRQVCSTRIAYNNADNDITNDILHLRYHPHNHPEIESDAYFSLGLYELKFDLYSMIDSTNVDEKNIDCNEIIVKSMNFIATVIIMSIQIAAVLSKKNLDKEFFEKVRDGYTPDNFNPNPIMIWFEAFFTGAYTTNIMNSGEEESEISYVAIDYSIEYIMERMKESGACMLLSYFPLYLANYNNDIISEEEIYTMFEKYGTKSDFKGMGWKAPDYIPEEYTGYKPTVFDLVNDIIRDQEG